MTEAEKKEFLENFDENWQYGEVALEVVLQEWKQNFTRREVVEKLLCALKDVNNCAEMNCFMIALLAERLVGGFRDNGGDDQVAAE